MKVFAALIALTALWVTRCNALCESCGTLSVARGVWPEPS